MAIDRRVEIDWLIRLVEVRTGMNLSGSLVRHAVSGLARAMVQLGEADVAALRTRLARDPGALETLVDEIVVGETYFFREPQHFELVSEEVLPVIGRRWADGGSGLRAWSAGCASGEELYSLAIVLAEAGYLGGAHLVGTDLSRRALAVAREGRYRPWSMRGAGAERAAPWLHQEGGLLALDHSLRRSVFLLPLNLVSDRYPDLTMGLADMDLILCRNVLLYFEPATVARVVRHLADTLAPGGWLLTGASDPPLVELADLEPLVWKDVVVYRRQGVAERRSRPSCIRLRPRVRAVPRPALDPVERVRSLADREPVRALSECASALRRQPMSVELHHLDGVLRLGLGDVVGAEAALRRTIDLDPELAIAHFLLGSLLRYRGDVPGARRAFRMALEQARSLPEDAVLALTDGETAGRLARAAASRLAELDPGAVA